ncbi:hypothetical protein LTR36_008926 [Oleoguttula mirabilis]|uniref:Uncharacterized protein n=1 Tax=Oleoguttula mirabilis TaxID=1507867 RepID=A0AAV9J6U2_9PEZI|nr:hypothetical protein LTR36_008926 [Oleoguttula mirabilis]
MKRISSWRRQQRIAFHNLQGLERGEDPDAVLPDEQASLLEPNGTQEEPGSAIDMDADVQLLRDEAEAEADLDNGTGAAIAPPRSSMATFISGARRQIFNLDMTGQEDLDTVVEEYEDEDLADADYDEEVDGAALEAML